MTVMFVVRHAMPEIDRAVPAGQWHLGAEGRAAARRLSPLIPVPADYVASTEPKAVETLRELASTVTSDAGFSEVRRPDVWVDGDGYRSTAFAYVRGEPHEGWEPRDQVVERFEAAVQRHAAAGRALVVGTHGLAATVWMASRCRLESSPEEFWRGLRLPDVVKIDLATGRVAKFD